jgi:hypothetical protein
MELGKMVLAASFAFPLSHSQRRLLSPMCRNPNQALTRTSRRYRVDRPAQRCLEIAHKLSSSTISARWNRSFPECFDVKSYFHCVGMSPRDPAFGSVGCSSWFGMSIDPTSHLDVGSGEAKFPLLRQRFPAHPKGDGDRALF